MSSRRWHLPLLIFFFSVPCIADVLSSALSSLYFDHGLTGLSQSNDRVYQFTLVNCYYLEAENVTRGAPPLHGWGQGPCQIPYLDTDASKIPPTGVRDSVPLGGLGAGGFELRADGTFHEVTLQSASPAASGPAGSAKYGVLADAMLALRVGDLSFSLRTAPPPYAFPGLQGIAYNGLYPVSRLALQEPSLTAMGLEATLYAYSKLIPTDPASSSAPGIAFSLVLNNTGATPLPNASLYFQLPMGAINDCVRGGVPLHPPTPSLSYAQCRQACQGDPGCSQWQYNNQTSTCALFNTTGGSLWAAEHYCGLPGAWTANSTSGALSYVLR